MDREREEQVAALLAAVQAEGDAAVRRLTLQFDGVDMPPENLRVPADSCRRALKELPPHLADALGEAARRIRYFHEQTRPKDHLFTGPDG